MKETCENCRFRVNSECHRYPRVGSHVSNRFWCGEWKSVPETVAAFPSAVRTLFTCKKCGVDWIQDRRLIPVDRICDGCRGEVDDGREKCARCGRVGQECFTLAMSCGDAMVNADDSPTKYTVPFYRLYPEQKGTGTAAPYAIDVCKQCRDDWIAAVGQWFTWRRENHG